MYCDKIFTFTAYLGSENANLNGNSIKYMETYNTKHNFYNLCIVMKSVLSEN